MFFFFRARYMFVFWRDLGYFFFISLLLLCYFFKGSFLVVFFSKFETDLQ